MLLLERELFEGVGDEVELVLGVGEFLLVARDEVCGAGFYL